MSPIKRNRDQQQQQRMVCPSCNHDSIFKFVGEQRWPEQVARATGLPPVVLMWTCNHCHTTISEPAR